MTLSFTCHFVKLVTEVFPSPFPRSSRYKYGSFLLSPSLFLHSEYQQPLFTLPTPIASKTNNDSFSPCQILAHQLHSSREREREQTAHSSAKSATIKRLSTSHTAETPTECPKLNMACSNRLTRIISVRLLTCVRAMRIIMEAVAEFASEGEAAMLLRQIFTQPQTFQGPVTLLPIEDVGDEQEQARRKEHSLMMSLKHNLEIEINAAIRHERPRLPDDPKELEKEYLEQMSFLGASLAYVTLAIRAAPRASERRARFDFLRSQPEQPPESDEISEMLKFFRRMQPNLAERSIKFWEKFQEYKDWKRWYTNGDMNIPPP